MPFDFESANQTFQAGLGNITALLMKKYMAQQEEEQRIRQEQRQVAMDDAARIKDEAAANRLADRNFDYSLRRNENEMQMSVRGEMLKTMFQSKWDDLLQDEHLLELENNITQEEMIGSPTAQLMRMTFEAGKGAIARMRSGMEMQPGDKEALGSLPPMAMAKLQRLANEQAKEEAITANIKATTQHMQALDRMANTEGGITFDSVNNMYRLMETSRGTIATLTADADYQRAKLEFEQDTGFKILDLPPDPKSEPEEAKAYYEDLDRAREAWKKELGKSFPSKYAHIAKQQTAIQIHANVIREVEKRVSHFKWEPKGTKKGWTYVESPEEAEPKPKPFVGPVKPKAVDLTGGGSDSNEYDPQKGRGFAGSLARGDIAGAGKVLPNIGKAAVNKIDNLLDKTRAFADNEERQGKVATQRRKYNIPPEQNVVAADNREDVLAAAHSAKDGDYVYDTRAKKMLKIIKKPDETGKMQTWLHNITEESVDEPIY